VLTIVLLVALAAFAAPAAAALYLGRLPYAPECPHCRAVTSGARGGGTRLDRLCALAAATPVRSCARCGWAGRMRWKLAPQRAAARQP
jgi:hypothetical protein